MLYIVASPQKIKSKKIKIKEKKGAVLRCSGNLEPQKPSSGGRGLQEMM
jgi:hypothetical protein